VHEFVQFKERLQNSLQFALSAVEKLLLDVTRTARFLEIIFIFTVIVMQQYVMCSVLRDLSNYRSTAGIIYELLLAKSGLGVISSLCVTDIDFIIDYLCVS